jgi:hypothetical protein
MFDINHQGRRLVQRFEWSHLIDKMRLALSYFPSDWLKIPLLQLHQRKKQDVIKYLIQFAFIPYLMRMGEAAVEVDTQNAA